MLPAKVHLLEAYSRDKGHTSEKLTRTALSFHSAQVRKVDVGFIFQKGWKEFFNLGVGGGGNWINQEASLPLYNSIAPWATASLVYHAPRHWPRSQASHPLVPEKKCVR